MKGYDALCTKSRAMHGGMLKQKDYEILSKLEQIDEAVQYLARTPRYAEAFSGKEPVWRRGRVEQLLRGPYFLMFEKLYLFSEGAKRQFFAHLIEKHEIAFLVRAVRAVNSEGGERFTAVPQEVQRRASLNFIAVCEAQSLQGVIDALSGTQYHSAALRFLSEPSADIDLFENALYRDYYIRLHGVYCECLDKESAQAVRRLLERQVDILNDERARRIAEYHFDLGALSLIPIYTEQKKKVLEDIIAGRGADQPRPDSSAARELYEVCLRTVYTGANTMAVPYALLALGENELKNLTYVIEGIRYQTGSAFILKKIVI